MVESVCQNKTKKKTFCYRTICRRKSNWSRGKLPEKTSRSVWYNLGRKRSGSHLQLLLTSLGFVWSSKKTYLKKPYLKGTNIKALLFKGAEFYEITTIPASLFYSLLTNPTHSRQGQRAKHLIKLQKNSNPLIFFHFNDS